MDPMEAVAMLEFLTLAIERWEPAMVAAQTNTEATDACLKYLADLKEPETIRHSYQSSDIFQYQIGAYIANILALLVHQPHLRGDTTAVKHIVPRLEYFTQFGVSPSMYNASLHHSLSKNFEGHFRCALTSFKKTSLLRSSLGPYFFYDIRLAGQMLRKDVAWMGKSNRGFSNEFARANLNLSMVEGQMVGRLMSYLKCLD